MPSECSENACPRRKNSQEDHSKSRSEERHLKQPNCHPSGRTTRSRTQEGAVKARNHQKGKARLQRGTAAAAHMQEAANSMHTQKRMVDTNPWPARNP